MNISESLLILSTLAGPVLAVQAQKWVERSKAAGDLRFWIFRTLMSTRATRISAEHVTALNMIDLAFYGRRLLGTAIPYRNKADQAVVDAWHEYQKHLTPEPPIQDHEIERGQQWSAKGEELFLNLLSALAKASRYKFDRGHLRTGGYNPMSSVIIEREQARLRKLFIEALSTEGPAALRVMPSHPLTPGDNALIPRR